MNKAQYKDPIYHICLAGALVASWSLIQEVAGLSLFTVRTNMFVNEFSKFSETFRRNSIGFRFQWQQWPINFPLG